VASYLSWATLAVLVPGLLIGFPLLVLLPLGLYAAMLGLERADRPAEAFALWAFGLGCLICFGTEIVYIRDVFESRMNTIFKFYYQAWLIWGVLAGYALWWLFARRTTDHSTSSPRVAHLASGILAALFCALLAGALVYPWLTAGKAFREGQAVGLHGTTPRERTPAGAAAIAWLRAHVPSNAVVLEAAGESSYEAYDGRGLGIGGVSASTGLATVIGWAGHERQWRGGDPSVYAQIEQRYHDVTAIYSTTDVAQARELLARYAVDYIYVGAAERALYPPEGLAKLAQLGTPVFQQDEVTIYQVG
jgi:YYY domain-containing protein